MWGNVGTKCGDKKCGDKLGRSPSSPATHPRRRVARVFDLASISNAVGAPSFAHFAKGGSWECQRQVAGGPFKPSFGLSGAVQSWTEKFESERTAPLTSLHRNPKKTAEQHTPHSFVRN
jgi:hypothetical protein